MTRYPECCPDTRQMRETRAPARLRPAAEQLDETAGQPRWTSSTAGVGLAMRLCKPTNLITDDPDHAGSTKTPTNPAILLAGLANRHGMVRAALPALMQVNLVFPPPKFDNPALVEIHQFLLLASSHMHRAAAAGAAWCWTPLAPRVSYIV